MSKLVFDLPSRDAPGYLRRQQEAMRFRKKIDGLEREPEVIDDIVEFLLPYVIEPEDRDEARQLFFDEATENQYRDLLNAVIGGGANPTKQTQNQSDTS